MIYLVLGGFLAILPIIFMLVYIGKKEGSIVIPLFITCFLILLIVWGLLSSYFINKGILILEKGGNIESQRSVIVK